MTARPLADDHAERIAALWQRDRDNNRASIRNEQAHWSWAVNRERIDHDAWLLICELAGYHQLVPPEEMAGVVARNNEPWPMTGGVA